MTTSSDDRLCRALEADLTALRADADTVSAAVPKMADGRVYVAARLLVDVQAFTVHLKAAAEELR